MEMLKDLGAVPAITLDPNTVIAANRMLSYGKNLDPSSNRQFLDLIHVKKHVAKKIIIIIKRRNEVLQKTM